MLGTAGSLVWAAQRIATVKLENVLGCTRLIHHYLRSRKDHCLDQPQHLHHLIHGVRVLHKPPVPDLQALYPCPVAAV